MTRLPLAIGQEEQHVCLRDDLNEEIVLDVHHCHQKGKKAKNKPMTVMECLRFIFL